MRANTRLLLPIRLTAAADEGADTGQTLPRAPEQSQAKLSSGYWTATMDTHPKPKRRRRTSDEIKTLLVNSARELFAERGFGGTTTREIADRAGVDETLLFRNFTNKERIFQEAVARPIERFLNDYTEHWLHTPLAESDPEEILRAFVESLYDLASANRLLLLAATPNHLGHGAQGALAQLERLAAETAAAQGFDYDSAIAIRAAVAMVITVAVFDEPLFGTRGNADRDRVVNELTGILTYGLTRRRA
jgi:AcrR family transcriptional regulator